MQLEAKKVSFRYAAKQPLVLHDVDFSVQQGERVGLVAPSGGGKTTLLKLLTGQLAPTSGQILLNGKPLAAKGRLPVQWISQHPETAVNPRWRMHKVLQEADMLRPEVLAALGIAQEWLHRYPCQLSGGELQRFCVARALCHSTQFLLADEISTMLDAITQAQIWQFVLQQVQHRRLGLVVITHNPLLAQRLCTRSVSLASVQTEVSP